MDPQTIGYLIAGAGVLVGAGSLTFAALAWLSSKRNENTSNRSLEVSEESLAVAKDSLTIANAQASAGPRISVEAEIHKWQRSSAYGSLVITLINSGNRAANNVHGWIDFHESVMEPPKEPSSQAEMIQSINLSNRGKGTSFHHSEKPNSEGVYQATISRSLVIVDSRQTFKIQGSFMSADSPPTDAAVRCNIVSDEGNLFEGYVETPLIITSELEETE